MALFEDEHLLKTLKPSRHVLFADLLHIQPKSVRAQNLQFLSFLSDQRLKELRVLSFVPGEFRPDVIEVRELEPLVMRGLCSLQNLPTFCLVGQA